MPGYYDIHCHLIPGVDDGSKSMRTTLEMLKMEYQDGVRTIILTPHYRRRMFECSMETILRQYELVKAEARKILPHMKLLLGCEFHANMEMIEILDRGERPTMAGTRCVLIEFSEQSKWEFIQDRIYMLRSHAYQPIIAHAERYSVFRKDIDKLEQIAEMGAYIQINSQSILGDDGFWMKRYCKRLIREDLIDFVGSDAHNLKERKPTLGRCAAYLEKLQGEEYRDRIMKENPESILKTGMI